MISERLASRVKGDRQSADYLFPHSAVMARHEPEAKLEAAAALPRSSGYELVLGNFDWSGRRSGEGTRAPAAAPQLCSPFAPVLMCGMLCARRASAGADEGVGTKADVILGGWSCCRSVNPVAGGCVTGAAHSRTAVKCAHCGTFFDMMDNLR